MPPALPWPEEPRLKATAYELVAPDPLSGGRFRQGVQLVLVYGRDAAQWAIRSGGDALNKSGEWEWEPNPSSRDDAFFARCRWATRDEAYAAWQAQQPAPQGPTT